VASCAAVALSPQRLRRLGAGISHYYTTTRRLLHAVTRGGLRWLARWHFFLLLRGGKNAPFSLRAAGNVKTTIYNVMPADSALRRLVTRLRPGGRRTVASRVLLQRNGAPPLVCRPSLLLLLHRTVPAALQRMGIAALAARALARGISTFSSSGHGEAPWLGDAAA